MEHIDVGARLELANPIATYLRGGATRWRAVPKAQRLYWVTLALVVALGAFLRLNGFLFGRQSSLWLDEALWAPRFISWPLLKLGIRPLGFVWLTRQLVAYGGATEFWFRFLANVGGVASFLLVPYVASRLVSAPALRLLFVLLFAIHPALVDLSKEFKPYSFEVFVHMLTLALYLRYEQTRKLGYAYALLAYLPLSFLLAYNMAFALPSLLLLVAWAAFERRSRPLFAAALLSGALCGVAVYAMYELSLGRVERQGATEAYWGRKYDVFYGPKAQGGRLAWTLEKAGDSAAMVGLTRELWTRDHRLSESTAEKLGSVDRMLWIALSILGIVALARRKRQHALLLLTPLLVLVAANALGKWPLGQFRTNLFACVYLLPLPLLALEMLRVWLGRRTSEILLGLVALDVLVGFGFTVDWHGHKRIWTQDGNAREVLRALYALRREELAEHPSAPRARLVLDLFSQKPLDYYLRVHPRFSQKFADFSEQFEVSRVSSRRLAEAAQLRLKHSKAWVYAVAAKATSASAMRTFIDANPKAVVRQRQLADDVVIMVVNDDRPKRRRHVTSRRR